MKSIKSLLIVLSSASLISLGACGNNNQATNSESSPTPAEPTAQPTSAAKTESSGHAAKPLKGGQVVESGPYHLEFVPVKKTTELTSIFICKKGTITRLYQMLK
jgi:hypothetical protein